MAYFRERIIAYRAGKQASPELKRPWEGWLADFEHGFVCDLEKILTMSASFAHSSCGYGLASVPGQQIPCEAFAEQPFPASIKFDGETILRPELYNPHVK